MARDQRDVVRVVKPAMGTTCCARAPAPGYQAATWKRRPIASTPR